MRGVTGIGSKRPKADRRLEPRPSSDSIFDVADLMPPDANMHGTVFGGKVLQMVDKAASVCALRHSGKPCVTVAMERVEFLVPASLLRCRKSRKAIRDRWAAPPTSERRP